MDDFSTAYFNIHIAAIYAERNIKDYREVVLKTIYWEN